MSEYVIVQVQYSDPSCIKAALKEMGYLFEDHKVKQSLYGYRGDKRTQKANIIVRRQHVGDASNDVGFLLKANGKYELIISEYDKGVKQTATNMMERMRQLYSKHKSLKKLRSMSKSVLSVKTDDKGRIIIKAFG